MTVLPPQAFAKQDASDDALFYEPVRLVTHIDDGAIDAVRARYGAAIAPGSAVLDLMSSWVSHLPDGLPLGEVVGHGMNADELAANLRLDRWFVQDLNRDPPLPLADATFDAVTCCVSVQYMQRPYEVFAEIARVLRPGGRVLVSFANRCFPTKAVMVWHRLDMAGRAALVRSYMDAAVLVDATAVALTDGRAGDPLVMVEARRPVERA